MERNIEISGPLQRRSRFLSCKPVAEKRNSESVPKSWAGDKMLRMSRRFVKIHGNDDVTSETGASGNFRFAIRIESSQRSLHGSDQETDEGCHRSRTQCVL